MIPASSLGTWPRKSAEALFSAINVIVFLFLDGIECILCLVYRFLDSFLEGKASPPCYCAHGGETSDALNGDEAEEGESEISESLYRRENFFRDMWLTMCPRKHGSARPEKRAIIGNGGRRGIPVRWSDCRCRDCISWMGDKEQKLHVVVKELSGISREEKATENVIFLHGFLSSSSLWTELVFPNLPEPGAANYRLFAVDLLGFGKSPKPRDCFYTLRDHVEMIEKSVIRPFQLDSFHVVAHSMGCVIAVALASKYRKSVKSVTLTAPPYFPSTEAGDASLTALRRLVSKRLWPPLLFGSSVMSWYEHLGRCVCFLICRNHRMWEGLVKFVTGRRDLYFPIVDLTRHTHHSAWHTMHNVICGGIKLMDRYLETLRGSRMRISIVHGDRDSVVPLECSLGIKMRVPEAEVNIIRDADHNTVMFRREKEFARFLRRVWDSSSEIEG